MEMFWILVLFGLAMYTAQIRAIVIMFWGHQKAPKGFKIIVGILLILNFLAMVGMSMNNPI